MTQEEKARAYDEALERARALRQEAIDKEYAIDYVKDYEAIFPELRESEDESTRKALIETVKCIYAGDTMFLSEQQRDRYLDWLEKQKYDRMQPVYDNLDSFESALAKAWKAYNDSGARTVDGCEDDYVECAHAKGFREGFLYGLEKQKEQKPWKVGANAYFTPEQKPADLSDMIVHKEPYIAPVTTPMVADEQKPAEWRHYIWAINMRFDYTALIKYDNTNNYEIVQAGNRPKQEKNGVYILIKDIKPQPSWKPSEEQMKALNETVNILAASPFLHQNDYLFNILNGLREELKKLM